MEADQGLLLGRAVDTQPRSGIAPIQHVLVGLGDRRWLPTAQKIALDVVDAALLDLSLVLRCTRSARGDQKAIMLCTLPVGLLYPGIVPGGLDDGCLQVVDHHTFWYTIKPRQSIPVQAQPGLDLLVKDELDVLVAAPRQRHRKEPRLARLACIGVDHLPGIPKVDLSFFTRLPFHSYRCFRHTRFDLAHEATYRGVGSRVLSLLETFPDSSDLDVFLDHLGDDFPVWLDR